MSKQTSESLYSIKASQFDTFELPEIKSVRGKDYMYYGAKNLFPQELIRLYDTSAIHHTCIDAIKDGIIGDGIEIIGDEYANQKGETIEDVFQKISLDYTLFNAYCLNVVWSKDRTKIVEFYHIPFSQVRSGKPDEDGNVNEYFYSSDWTSLKKNPAVSYKSFDPTDNKGDNASQIYYCYNYTPGLDVYSLPSYVGALNDIELDHRISVFHNANISNGINPSMFINFRNGIPSEQERNTIYRELEDSFSGEGNAGKYFLGFSEPGKEMEITPIEGANDGLFTVLDERISSRILTAHRVTSPMLLGVKDASGFSSNADEIKVAYAHFISTVIEPKRKKILSTYGYILKFYGYNIKLEVAPKQIVMETTTVNETNTQQL